MIDNNLKFNLADMAKLLSHKTSCDRSFRWISSITGDTDVLLNLNQEMAWFYGQQEGRHLYQTMIEDTEKVLISQESIRYQVPKYICKSQPEHLLEIGCANGRLYRQLRSYGYIGAYNGIEVADYLIEQNIKQHPDATWKCASAYEIPFAGEYFDMCFSLYVLEHLVYPESALREMLRILKPGGRCVLVFPDFVESGRFASQQLGFSPIGSALKKLRLGKVIDALVSFYDSRIRLPKALKKAIANFGAFPVNTSPVCLSYPSVMGGDVDAIYIASKKEVHDWAVTNGYQVEYPCSTEGEFTEQAFMVIHKP